MPASRFRALLPLPALFLMAGLGTDPVPAPAAELHFALARSAPEAGSMVHAAPAEVRLWFTEAPQAGSAAVRITDAAGRAVSMGELSVASDDPREVGVSFSSPPASGVYTVTWRGMGADGHVVTGTFTFHVMVMESPHR